MLSTPRRVRAAFSVFVLSLVLPLSTLAAQRTFVATTGSDANTATNCSNTAPCRGFAAALTVTDSGGEIIVLNSGGYGPVTITKSVSVIAPEGVYAGLSVLSGDGVTIVTAGVKVVLRGLTINGLGGGYGVVMAAGDELTVENCQISNFSYNGVYVYAAARAHVLRTVLRNNDYGAYFEGGAQAIVEETKVSGGSIGIGAAASGSSVNTAVAVSRSEISFASSNGVLAMASASGTARLAVKDTVLANNTRGGYVSASGGTIAASFSGNLIYQNGTGLRAYGSGATLTASGNTVSQGTSGLAQAGSAVFESTGDNIVQQNTTQFSGTITSVLKM